MKSTNKPAIRFKGYNDAWEQRKFDEVFDCTIPNNTLSRAELNYESGSVRNIHYGDILIKYGSVVDVQNDEIPFATGKSSDDFKGALLQDGDIIIADTAEDETTGKACEIGNSQGLDVVSGLHTMVCRPRNKMALGYLGYYLNSDAYHHQLLPLMQGIKVLSLSRTNVQKTMVCYPKSKAEQQLIADCFRNLDNLITLHQRECTKLKNIKNITLTKMIKSIPDLKFSKFTNVWEQRKLSEISTMHARIGWQNLRTSEFLDSGDYMLITGTDFNDGAINYSTCHYVERERYEQDKHIQIKNGNILITKDGTLGKVAYVQGLSMPATLNAGVFNVEIKNKTEVDNKYLFQYIKAPFLMNYVNKKATGGTIKHLNQNILIDFIILMPSKVEQEAIGNYFEQLDHLITLHQRECKNQNGRCHMLSEVVTTDLFCDYYIQWVKVYKEGAVRKVTLDKYMMTYSWLLKLASHLRLCDITRVTYQQILNDYAITHEKQTTMDFHHQLKGAIADAVDDGLITKDPTRKAIIKGKTPTPKKIKYLNQYELHTLLSNLQLKDEINWDWLILLVAKTGMRFSEALAITPSDFDFAHQMLSISKTWNYKGNGGFLPTKNKSSVRKIQLDWQTVIQFSELVKRLPPEKPIFITKERVYNSTVNDVLARHCTKNNIPVISIHGLRHTHASLLLFAGVSIASVARRLGHSSMTTTQKTYLHIIQELENKDIDLVMRSLSGLS